MFVALVLHRCAQMAGLVGPQVLQCDRDDALVHEGPREESGRLGGREEVARPQPGVADQIAEAVQDPFGIGRVVPGVVLVGSGARATVDDVPDQLAQLVHHPLVRGGTAGGVLPQFGALDRRGPAEGVLGPLTQDDLPGAVLQPRGHERCGDLRSDRQMRGKPAQRLAGVVHDVREGVRRRVRLERLREGPGEEAVSGRVGMGVLPGAAAVEPQGVQVVRGPATLRILPAQVLLLGSAGVDADYRGHAGAQPPQEVPGIGLDQGVRQQALHAARLGVGREEVVMAVHRDPMARHIDESGVAGLARRQEDVQRTPEPGEGDLAAARGDRVAGPLQCRAHEFDVLRGTVERNITVREFGDLPEIGCVRDTEQQGSPASRPGACVVSRTQVEPPPNDSALRHIIPEVAGGNGRLPTNQGTRYGSPYTRHSNGVRNRRFPSYRNWRWAVSMRVVSVPGRFSRMALRRMSRKMSR